MHDLRPVAKKRLLHALLLGLALLLGAYLRFAFLEGVTARESGEEHWRGYPVYHSLAGSIIREGGMFDPAGAISTSRMPGYPVFIAAMTRLSDGSPAFPLKAQILLSALCSLFLFHLGRRVHSDAAGLLAALAWAAAPAQVPLPSYYYIETLYALAVIGTLLALLRFQEAPSKKTAVVLGLVLGAGCAIRTTLFLLPIFLALVSLLKKERRNALLLLLAALVSHALLVPRAARNYAYEGKLVFYEGNTALANIYSASEGKIHAVTPNSGLYEEISGRIGASGMGEIESYMRSRIAGNLAADPGRFLLTSGQRAASFAMESISVFGDRPAARLAVLALILFSVVSGRRNPKLVCAALVAAYFILIHAPLASMPRFAYPLHPVIIILASSGAAGLLKRLGRTAPGGEPAGAAPPRRAPHLEKAAYALLGALYLLTLGLHAREAAMAGRRKELAAKHLRIVGAPVFNGREQIPAFGALLSEKDLPAGLRCKVNNDIGAAFIRLGEPDSALPHLKSAVAACPGREESVLNMETALRMAGAAEKK